MRKGKLITNLLLTILFTLTFGIQVFAYDDAHYKKYPSWNADYYVSNRNNGVATSQVALYMYTEVSNRKVKNNNNFYAFSCVSQKTDYRSFISLIYEFSPYNAEVYDTLENGEVWVWQFKIENGDYDFISEAGQGKAGIGGIRTLNLDYKVPTENYDEVRTIEDGTIRVYALYGSDNWRKQNEEEFSKWAQETEKSFLEQDAVMDANNTEGEVTQSIITVEEETPSIEETPSKEAKTEIPVIPSVEEEVKTEEITEKKEGPNLLAYATAVVILGGVGFALVKKNKN